MVFVNNGGALLAIVLLLALVDVKVVKLASQRLNVRFDVLDISK